MKHVITGSGAAGIAAAKTLRSINKTCEITLISSDDVLYSRCMLHKYFGNERDITRLSFVPDDFFSTHNITWHKGVCVNGIDTKNNCVLMQNTTLSYDKLLIATGSDAVIPDVGALGTATNVYGFRHLTDVNLIREKLARAENILVIGAGLVGIDVAYALLKLHKAVTVVKLNRATTTAAEITPQIMSLNMDSTAAFAYQKLFEQNGCNFRLDNTITHTFSNEKGAITHVVLETGEKLACDVIIVAAGVRPSVKFLEHSGIELERGVKVNQHLETSCENIYAAGSVTALGDIWQNAVRQGEVAAKNMCGMKTPFTDTFTAKTAVNFFDLPTVSVGIINPENGDTVLTRKDSNVYQKIILRNNTIVGVTMQGDIAHSGIWQYLIKNKVNLSNLKKSVWDLSFADFYDIDETGQYKYNQSSSKTN